jgi:4-amino-4-deoxy-L-arabinose transferase-like glycosyltransferase
MLDAGLPDNLTQMKIRHLPIIIIILLLAAGLRLFNLSSVPPPLNVDEASNAYDAYSLLRTGRDQWGNLLPITIRAFNDYRRPASVYSAIPFIAIFNLTVFSIRAMAAFWGWWAVVFIYRLARDMFNQEIALVSALMMALSPWHIVFSRLGVEVSGPLLTSVIAGIDFSWRWFQSQKNIWLLLSGFAFSISIYSYTVAQAFTPLMLITLTIVFWSRLRDTIKIGLATLLLIGLLILPLAITLVSNPLSWNRLQTIGILKPPYRTSIPLFFSQWLGYFTPSFLFWQGDSNPIHHPPGSGQLLWIDVLLIPLGIVRVMTSSVLARKKHGICQRNLVILKTTQRTRRAFVIILLWIILGALPAALTRQDMVSANAMRGILSLPGWIILSSIGVDILWSLWQNIPGYTAIFRGLSISFYILNALFVLQFYFMTYPKLYARAFEYGIQQVMHYVFEHEEEYNKIILTDWISQPHIFAVFYNRYDPYEFQRNHAPYGDRLSEKLTAWGHKYEAGNVETLYDKLEHGLFVARPHMLTDIEPVVVIYHPDGSMAFKIIAK